MSDKEVTSLSLLGRELGQFLLICLGMFAMIQLIEHFWNDPLTMLAGSAALVAAMLLVKRDLAVSVTGLAVGVIAPLAEMPLVEVGAWSYGADHIEGVPSWLFLVWCAIGIFIGSLFEFLRVLIAQAETPRIDGR